MYGSVDRRYRDRRPTRKTAGERADVIADVTLVSLWLGRPGTVKRDRPPNRPMTLTNPLSLADYVPNGFEIQC